jgi:hypothetical protein
MKKQNYHKYSGISAFALWKQNGQEKNWVILFSLQHSGTYVLGSITPQNPPRHLQAAVTQKWWLVCVGVVLDMAHDGRPPPVVASSARSWCSSRDGTLGWCRPLGGVGARCSLGAVRVQSVAHSEWRGRSGSFIVYAFASRQGTKTY